jgi:Flp pilus assembly pilin Flp
MRPNRRAVCGPAVQEVLALTRFRLLRREDGQTMAEYAVVIGVITPIIVLAFAAMSDAVASRLETIVGFLS